MPERMRLIRNRAQVIYNRSSGVDAGASPATVNAGTKESPIPLEARHHYFGLAEKELIEEGKIECLAI